jgi:hypothetical protein
MSKGKLMHKGLVDMNNTSVVGLEGHEYEHEVASIFPNLDDIKLNDALS